MGPLIKKLSDSIVQSFSDEDFAQLMVEIRKDLDYTGKDFDYTGLQGDYKHKVFQTVLWAYRFGDAPHVLLLAKAVATKRPARDNLKRLISEIKDFIGRAVPAPQNEQSQPLPELARQSSHDFAGLLREIERQLRFGGIFTIKCGRKNIGDEVDSTYLLRVLLQRLVHASSRIHQSAIGSANLWVSHSASIQVSEKIRHRRPTLLRSEEREGYFSLEQLVIGTGNKIHYRSNPVSYDTAKLEQLSVAARAIVEARPFIGSSTASLYDSQAEQRRGISHILGIPLIKDINDLDVVPDGVPLSITVDFAFDVEPQQEVVNELIAKATKITDLAECFRRKWHEPWVLPRRAGSGAKGGRNRAVSLKRSCPRPSRAGKPSRLPK